MWTQEQQRAVPALLLEWYRVNARPMPWHSQIDAYHLLVAATMLQQTQVETVLPYLQRFLQRFPTVQHLADASEEEVLHYWSGLGYYSRARNLHRTAQQIMEKYGGAVPHEVHLLRQLPGVGEYTAGAVASIAYGQPEPALDANGYRILARLLAFEEDITRAASRRLLQQVCRQIIPVEDPGGFNQALMDLGAKVCTARSPRCLICPLAEVCQAFQQGKQNRLPCRPERQPTQRVEDVCVVLERGGRWLVVQRATGRLWRGMWEFPRTRLTDGETARQAAQRLVEAFGALVADYRYVGSLRHGVMHYNITLHVIRCPLEAPLALAGEAQRWVSEKETRQLPLPSPMRRVVDLLKRVE